MLFSCAERGDHHDCVVVDRYDPLVFADQVRGLVEAGEHLHELVGSEHLVVRGDGTKQRFIVVELAGTCGHCPALNAAASSVMEGERSRSVMVADSTPVMRVAIGRERRSRGLAALPNRRTDAHCPLGLGRLHVLDAR